MELKTQGVADLVREVLATLPQPYGEDIIEDVCVAIEHNPVGLESITPRSVVANECAGIECLESHSIAACLRHKYEKISRPPG